MITIWYYCFETTKLELLSNTKIVAVGTLLSDEQVLHTSTVEGGGILAAHLCTSMKLVRGNWPPMMGPRWRMYSNFKLKVKTLVREIRTCTSVNFA